MNIAETTDRSLRRFVSDTLEPRDAGSSFEGTSDRLLRIDVDGGVWLRPGAAVAYRGDISFERRPTLEAHSLKDAFLRETAPLVRATGHGQLFCGHHGWHVQVIRLAGETLFVSREDLLAFQDSLVFEPTLVAGISLAAGGLVVVRFSGHGALAIVAHGTPLTLPVTPDAPISTDPNATLAWSEDLTPSLKTDLTWRSVFHHGGQQPIQMLFQGTGFVVVQPFKDPRRFSPSPKLTKEMLSLLTGL